MNWKHLTQEDEVEAIITDSQTKPQLIFKHSTRCSISSMAKSRLEREWNLDTVSAWYLDLITYRNISNFIEHRLNLRHESPQAILIENGEVKYHASHNAMSIDDITKALP